MGVKGFSDASIRLHIQALRGRVHLPGPLAVTTWIKRVFQLPLFPAAGALLVVGALIFWQFLVGDALLLYKDIGSDSIQSYYPEFVHLSHYIRTVGYPSWSFYVGMGQDLAYLAGHLIWQPVTWLPKSWIAHGLVWQHLAKVLLVGLLFFRFLQLRGLRALAPLLGSLLLAFSGYMAIGTCWYPLADEVVAFAAVLLGCELAIQRGRWLLLAFSVAATGIVNPFFLYLCALFLVCYVPLRLFAEHGWRPTVIARACLILAAVAVVGVALGAVITLPYLYAILNSPRGLATTPLTTALLGKPVFGFESAAHYLTALYRPFANHIMGVGADFRGWQNYLEAPLTYCGLVSLLLLPQVFRGGSRRRRTIAAVVLSALILPTIFPWLRHLFWLFKGDYYRTYSLFWILAVITFAVAVFARYIEGAKLSLSLLIGTTAVLLAVLFIPIGHSQQLLEPHARNAAAIFLLAYSAAIIGGQMMKRPRLAACAVIAITALELSHFNRISVTHRYLTRSQLQARTDRKEATRNAIRDIKAADQSFFRITKRRPAATARRKGLNDALVFAYYGTSSYSSFNNARYTDFLAALGALEGQTEMHTRWAIGTLNNPLLSTFAGEKYALVDDPASFENTLSYRFVRQYGPNYLFVNELFMPLGVSFTRYITEQEFLRLPLPARTEVLFNGVVLPDGDTHGLQPLDPIQNAPIENVIAERRGHALQLTSFQQATIEGTIRLDEQSILVVQTPFDRGWRASANGAAVPVVKVDIGLLGVALPPGEHKVRLHYENPWFLPGAALTCAALLSVAFAQWRWRRLLVSPAPGLGERLCA